MVAAVVLRLAIRRRTPDAARDHQTGDQVDLESCRAGQSRERISPARAMLGQVIPVGMGGCTAMVAQASRTPRQSRGVRPEGLPALTPRLVGLDSTSWDQR